MKFKIPLIGLLAALGLSAQAQEDSANARDWKEWQVTARDDCSTTRAITNYVINPATGEVTPDVRHQPALFQ
jgi:hypothetical protein